MKEFTRYVQDDDEAFVVATIQAVGRIASNVPDMADRALNGLMALVTGPSPPRVLAEGVVVIRQLLQEHRDHEGLVVRLIKRLNDTEVPAARAAIVWILGEFLDKPRVKSIAPDMLRILAKGFRTEHHGVKLQILTLAVKVFLTHPESQQVRSLTCMLPTLLVPVRFACRLTC